jgi:ribulose bisphosphate carboxylase small subunit
MTVKFIIVLETGYWDVCRWIIFKNASSVFNNCQSCRSHEGV